MELNLIRQQLWSRRRSLLFYGIGVALYGLFIVAVFPSVSKSGLASFKFEQMPDAFRRLFGEFNPLGSVDGYLAVQYFSFAWVIILGAFAIGVAANLAKGIEDGTMEMLLANPVHRRSVALGIYGSLAAGLAGFVILTYTGIAVTAAIGGVSLSYVKLLSFMLEGFLFFLAVGGVALLAASISSSGGRTVFISITFLIVSYLLHFLTLYWSGIAFLDRLSVFRYYNPTAVLVGQSSIWTASAVFAGIAIVSTALATRLYERRDLKF